MEKQVHMGKLDDLRDLYDRDDFKQVWITIATRIKIRRINTLNDLSEYRGLSGKEREELDGFNDIDGNHETLTRKGWFYNTDLILLSVKKNGNWIGVYQYDYTKTFTKVLALLLGTGVMIGGVYYFVRVAQECIVSLFGYIKENLERIREAIIQIFNGIGLIAAGAAAKKFKQWLFNDQAEFNTLVAACMLKKLEDTGDFQNEENNE